MISLKSFNLSRLLSQHVAPVCLGRELQGSNVFLDFFGCVAGRIARKFQIPSSEIQRNLKLQWPSGARVSGARTLVILW